MINAPTRPYKGTRLNLKRAALSFVGAVLISSLAPATYAHHSQSNFVKEFSELSGTVKSVRWRNPHLVFTMDVEGEDGETFTQTVETNSIYYLQRAGMRKEQLAIGDPVSIVGHVSRVEGGDFLASEIKLADGEHFFLIRDGVTSQFKDKIVDAAAEDKGIFRIWSIPQNNVRVLEESLTDAAKAKQAAFDITDNFATNCVPVGMPRIMRYPHPYEFIDKGDTILMRTEMYNAQRTIHMNGQAADPAAPYTLQGYSVGRWEDGVLVVKTDRIGWNYYDTRGIPQSYAAQVLERFTLSEDQSRLDWHISTTDPVTFTQPAVMSAHWLALGETIEDFDCELD